MTPVYARCNGVCQNHIELLFTGDQSRGLHDPFSSPPLPPTRGVTEMEGEKADRSEQALAQVSNYLGIKPGGGGRGAPAGDEGWRPALRGMLWLQRDVDLQRVAVRLPPATSPGHAAWHAGVTSGRERGDDPPPDGTKGHLLACPRGRRAGFSVGRWESAFVPA